MFSMQQLFIILAVAFGRFVLGWVWYSALFGDQWQQAMKESGKEGPKDPGQGLFFNFLAALATSFVICHLVSELGITTMLAGALLGFFCWLGFVIPPQIDVLMFEKQHKDLFVINTVYHLIALVLMGAFYGIWY